MAVLRTRILAILALVQFQWSIHRHWARFCSGVALVCCVVPSRWVVACFGGAGPLLHGELRRGPYLHGEVHSGGLARCRPRFVSLCERLPPCLRGVHAVARFLAAAWTRAEGHVTRGTFGCLLVRGLRSFPSWDGQSAEYPGVPSGAAWVRCLVRPGGLRRWRARERWQA